MAPPAVKVTQFSGNSKNMFYNPSFSLQSLKSKESSDNGNQYFKGYIHKPMALQGTESIDGIHKINLKELVSKKSKKRTPE